MSTSIDAMPRNTHGLVLTKPVWVSAAVKSCPSTCVVSKQNQGHPPSQPAGLQQLYCFWDSWLPVAPYRGVRNVGLEAPREVSSPALHLRCHQIRSAGIFSSQVLKTSKDWDPAASVGTCYFTPWPTYWRGFPKTQPEPSKLGCGCCSLFCHLLQLKRVWLHHSHNYPSGICMLLDPNYHDDNTSPLDSFQKMLQWAKKCSPTLKKNYPKRRL